MFSRCWCCEYVIFVAECCVFFYNVFLACTVLEDDFETCCRWHQKAAWKSFKNRWKIVPKTVQVRSFFAASAAEAVGDDFGTIFGPILGAWGRLLAARKRPGRRPWEDRKLSWKKVVRLSPTQPDMARHGPTNSGWSPLENNNSTDPRTIPRTPGLQDPGPRTRDQRPETTGMTPGQRDDMGTCTLSRKARWRI